MNAAPVRRVESRQFHLTVDFWQKSDFSRRISPCTENPPQICRRDGLKGLSFS
jgi:hypothetical protein